jgi:fumarate hydratase class I
MSEPIRLKTPLSEADVRRLRVGDEVVLSGTFITARDAAHRFLAQRDESEKPPFSLEGAVIYHCGPIMRRAGGGWEVVSAGPTTSARMETYEAAVLQRYGIRAIVGKGGMGPATAKALAETGAVYLTAASGAGALLAKRIVRVQSVWKLDEFGEPEAMWILEVADFPAIVAMDSAGGNIYDRVRSQSAQRLKDLSSRTG